MGAKRKKAAKKKKDKNPNGISASAATPNGNGDLKIQGSDGSSVSSPASQDNNQSNNPFSKREKAGNDSRDDNKENQRIVTNDEERNESFDSLKTIERLDIGDAVEYHNGAKVSNNGTKQNDEPQDVQKNSGRTKPLIDSVEPLRSVPDNKTISQFEGASVESVEIAETNKSLMEKTEARYLPSVVDPKITENQDTVIPLPDESSKEPTSAVDAALTETVDKILPPINAPFSKTSNSNGMRPTINMDTTNHSENQPLLALSPKPVQKTYWKGCCGLFEVLSSSDR